MSFTSFHVFILTALAVVRRPFCIHKDIIASFAGVARSGVYISVVFTQDIAAASYTFKGRTLYTYSKNMSESADAIGHVKLGRNNFRNVHLLFAHWRRL